MDDDWEDNDPYDDDPYSHGQPLTEFAMQILKAHRQNPAGDDYILMQGASLEETDAAYAELRREGLVEYSDRMLELPDGRRHTFRLTRNGM